MSQLLAHSGPRDCGAEVGSIDRTLLSDSFQNRIRVSSNGTARVSARSEVNCHPETCNDMEAGTPARSWGYVRRRGLHDLSCEASEDKCDGAGGCEVTHKMMRGYRVGRRGRREGDIMYEVMTQGPVLTLMEVTRDLFSYKQGIYRRLEAEVLGHHAVRIVGWGTEAGVKYWRLANTWGQGWGEDGMFRIGQWAQLYHLIAKLILIQ